MPVNPVYFQILSPQQANPLGFGIQQGTDIANSLMQARARALQNRQLQAQLPYADQMAQADLAAKQAQGPYVQSQTDLNQASLPYTGYKFLAPMLMAQARMTQAGIQNSNAFRQWAQTPQGAALIAQNPDMANSIAQAMQNSADMINGGGMAMQSPMQQMPPQAQGQMPQPGAYNNPSSYPPLPGMQTGLQGTPINAQQINQLRQLAQPVAPDTTSAIQNSSALLAQHKTSDASARQKNLYASNIEKTLNQINPDDLTQYAGRPISKFANQAAAPFGEESKNYDNYQKSLNAANLLATQVRQFYGDSIQPSMIQRLEGLTNPSTWSNNPILAKQLFNQTKQILGMETGTYRDAMQNTSPYKTQIQAMQSQAQAAQPTMSKVLNGTTYHKINGQWYAQ